MSPPKAVGAFLFFLNLGRVEGFGFDGKGRRAKREPGDRITHCPFLAYILFGQHDGTATQNDIQNESKGQERGIETARLKTWVRSASAQSVLSFSVINISISSTIDFQRVTLVALG